MPKVINKVYAVEVKLSAEDLKELEEALSHGCPAWSLSVKWKKIVAEWGSLRT